MNIWQQLKKPILILAPMEDVTDTVFRRIIKDCGRPDLFFTEFTNVEGMASIGDKIVSQRLLFTPEEKPLIAQIWGINPDHYFQAAQKILKMGFDGIDINMGCPQKSVVKNGSCSALIKNFSLTSEIIKSTQEGARSSERSIPVSVKTRIGYGSIMTNEWISFLLEHNLDALTVHGRTAKEMSDVPAHWEEIGKAVEIRNTMKKDTIIIGNGDVQSKADAMEKVKTYHTDGVMIGRGIFHDPFLFNTSVNWKTIQVKERFQILKKHIRLFDLVWKGKKHFPIMKKFVKIYVSDFEQASAIREELMNTQTSEEMITQIDSILSTMHLTKI